MPDHQFKFLKTERLSSRKTIGMLFEAGRSFYSHPFTVVWMEKESDDKTLAQVAISVPKKRHKKAVDRNRIKRVFRESWRHNKASLYNTLEQQNIHIVIMLVYSAQLLPSQKEMNKMIEKLIAKFIVVIKEPGRV